MTMGTKIIKGLGTLKNIQGRRKTPLEIRIKQQSKIGGLTNRDKKRGEKSAKEANAPGRGNKSRSKFDDDDSNDENEASDESSDSAVSQDASDNNDES